MTNWPKTAIYGLIILAVLSLGWLAASKMVSSIDYRNSDFFTFYLAGWMNWRDLDPYSSKQWIAGHDFFGVTWISNPIFPYPLPLATFLAPMGLLDLYNAFVIWVLISGILVFLTCNSLITSQETPKRAAYFLPLLAGVFLFRPTLVTFHDGQIGAFLLFIIGCVALLWKKEAWFIGGLFLGFIILKPNVGLPCLSFVGIWLIVQRRFSALAGLVISSLSLALIGIARDSNWLIDFLSNSNQKFMANFGASPTFWGLSGVICRYQASCTWQTGIFLVVGFSIFVIYYLWKMRVMLTPLAALGIAAAAAVTITPYIWAYDQILILICVIATVKIAIKTEMPYLIIASYPILLAALSAILVLVALNLGRDQWSVFIPLISLFNVSSG
jgi:hypothetical protein